MEGNKYRPNNDNLDPREGKLRPKKFWRRYLWQLTTLISVVLLVIFAISTFSLLTNRSKQTIIYVTPTSPKTQSQAGSTTVIPTSTTDTSTSTANTPTATPVTQTTILPCNVNIGTWTAGSQDWKVLHGVLLNDGTNSNIDLGKGPTIVAPCQLGNVSNYAVEAKIQVISTTNSPCFGITVRGNTTQDGWQGYKAGIGDCYNDAINDARLSGPDYYNDAQKKDVPFDPGKNVRTYRVEVKDNTIKFIIDTSVVVTLTDNRYLNGAEVGLWARNAQLQVLSFTVVAL